MAFGWNIDTDLTNFNNEDIELAFSLFPPMDAPTSPSALFNSNINSENEPGLPDNEQPVDLIKYLDCPDDYIKQENTSNEQEEIISGLLKSPFRIPSNIHMEDDDDFFKRSMLDRTPPRFYNKESWIRSPDKWNVWWTESIKEEPSPENQVLSAFIPDRIIKEEEPDYFMTPAEWKPTFYDDSKGSVSSDASSDISTDEENEILDVVSFADSPRAADFSHSLQNPSPVVVTNSTKPQSKIVCIDDVTRKPRSVGTDDVNRKRRPVGRPRKKPLEALTGKASTSLKSPQPQAPCSKSEYSAVSCVTARGQKRMAVKNESWPFKVQPQPAYTQVPSTSYSVNFHDYAMSPADCYSQAETETARPTVVARRQYRRNTTVDAVDKEKQNHHNQLERNRRQKLADLLVGLRDKVPSITGSAKASKVHILNEATSHIKELREQDFCQLQMISREQQRQKLLRNQLQQLKSKLSSNIVKHEYLN